MGKVKNGFISGVVGPTILRNVRGVQIVSAMPTHKKKNPRSDKQQEQRCKFRNVVNMYNALKCAGVIKDAFQDKDESKRDYDRFMSINLLQKSVYLTDRQTYSAVAGPYIISQGGLIGINATIENGVFVSDIKLGEIALTADTTIRDFAVAVIENNEGWAEDDELLFVSCLQTEDEDDPRIDCTTEKISLHCNSKSKMGKYTELGLCTDADSHLCHVLAGKGGFAFVHRRTTENKVLVSSQQLVVDNPLFVRYNSDEQKQLALQSWKKGKQKTTKTRE